jgi:hypothetical protein
MEDRKKKRNFFMENSSNMNTRNQSCGTQQEVNERRMKLRVRIEARRPYLEYKAADRANHAYTMVERVTSAYSPD